MIIDLELSFHFVQLEYAQELFISEIVAHTYCPSQQDMLLTQVFIWNSERDQYMLIDNAVISSCNTIGSAATLDARILVIYTYIHTYILVECVIGTCAYTTHIGTLLSKLSNMTRI